MPTHPRKTRVEGTAPPSSPARVKAPRPPRTSGRSDPADRPAASGVSDDEIQPAKPPSASADVAEGLKAEESVAIERPRLWLLQGPDAVVEPPPARRRRAQRKTATTASHPKRRAGSRAETTEPAAASTETSEVAAPKKRGRRAAEVAGESATDRAISTERAKWPKRSKAAPASASEPELTATPAADVTPAVSDSPIPVSTPQPTTAPTERETPGVPEPVSAAAAAPARTPVQEPELPHVTGLWRAAHTPESPDADPVPRVRAPAPAPVSIQVLTVPGRDPRIPSRADVVPPALVFVLQLVVGLIVGANPLVLLATAAAIVAVAYLVRRSIGIEKARGVRLPHARPISEVPAIQPSVRSSQVQLPGAPPPAAPTAAPIPAQPAIPAAPARSGSDLRWLWGTILRDPTTRPPRRDRR